jgi:hypothetical protein
MKIKYYGSDIIIYLKKENMSQMDFNDIDKLEDYFKTLFSKLNQVIEIEFNGFYLLDIYLDKYYGSIIKIQKEEVEYFDYYNQVEMKITIHDTEFLYQINDYFLPNKNIQSKVTYYYYQQKFYLKINEELNSQEMFELLEMSEVIYQTDNILKYGKTIKNML